MIAPGVVARLFEAGEGARVTLPIGGETATAFFRPIEVTGIVARLRRRHGRPIADYQDGAIDMGRTAVFEVGPVTMLVSELRGVAGNLPDVYRASASSRPTTRSRS